MAWDTWGHLIDVSYASWDSSWTRAFRGAKLGRYDVPVVAVPAPSPGASCRGGAGLETADRRHTEVHDLDGVLGAVVPVLAAVEKGDDKGPLRDVIRAVVKP